MDTQKVYFTEKTLTSSYDLAGFPFTEGEDNSAFFTICHPSYRTALGGAGWTWEG